MAGGPRSCFCLQTLITNRDRAWPGMGKRAHQTCGFEFFPISQGNSFCQLISMLSNSCHLWCFPKKLYTFWVKPLSRKELTRTFAFDLFCRHAHTHTHTYMNMHTHTHTLRGGWLDVILEEFSENHLDWFLFCIYEDNGNVETKIIIYVWLHALYNCLDVYI